MFRLTDGTAGNLFDLSKYGLRTMGVMITDFAIARTYRLIGDYTGTYQSGSVLDTESKDQAAK